MQKLFDPQVTSKKNEMYDVKYTTYSGHHYPGCVMNSEKLNFLRYPGVDLMYNIDINKI